MKDLIVLPYHKYTKTNQRSWIQHIRQVLKNKLWGACTREQARLIQKLNHYVSMAKHKSTAHKTTLVEFVHFITVTCRSGALRTYFVETTRDSSELFISLIHFCPVKPCYHVWVLHTLKFVPLFSGQRSKSLLQSHLLIRCEQLLPSHTRLIDIFSP